MPGLQVSPSKYPLQFVMLGWTLAHRAHEYFSDPEVDLTTLPWIQWNLKQGIDQVLDIASPTS